MPNHLDTYVLADVNAKRKMVTGHDISVEHFNIVGREENNLKRAIKEALYIRVNNPSLNRNVGKYHLPHIWDEVLDNISELKLK